MHGVTPYKSLSIKSLIIFSHYAGKVDVNSLVSFTDPEIYFRTPVQDHLMVKQVPLTIELIIEVLRETAFQVLALENWTDNVKLIHIGASSFDVVRLASKLESYLRTYLEGTQEVTSLNVNDVLDSLFRDILDTLLSKTLGEVAVYMYLRLSIMLMKQESCARQYEGNLEKHALKVVEPEKDLVSTSNKGQKRVYDDTGSTVYKQPRLAKDLYEAHGNYQSSVNADSSVHTNKAMIVDTLSLRGGRTYKNGRLVAFCCE